MRFVRVCVLRLVVELIVRHKVGGVGILVMRGALSSPSKPGVVTSVVETSKTLTWWALGSGRPEPAAGIIPSKLKLMSVSAAEATERLTMATKRAMNANDFILPLCQGQEGSR